MSILKLLIFSKSATSSETGERLVTSNYCDLAGANATERAALLTFTSALVDAGLYGYFPFIAPLVGNSVSNKMFNMVDPADDVAAFKMVPVGVPLNHAKGVQWQANQGATIAMQVNLLSSLPLIGGGCYAQDTNLRYAFLSNAASDFNIGFNDGGKTYVAIGASAIGVVAAATTGLLYGQREDANTVKSYKNAVERTSETLAINNFISTALTVDGLNNPVVSGYFIFNKALDATERTNFSNAWNALMISLNRNVA